MHVVVAVAVSTHKDMFVCVHASYYGSQVKCVHSYLE